MAPLGPGSALSIFCLEHLWRDGFYIKADPQAADLGAGARVPPWGRGMRKSKSITLRELSLPGWDIRGKLCLHSCSTALGRPKGWVFSKVSTSALLAFLIG